MLTALECPREMHVGLRHMKVTVVCGSVGQLRVPYLRVRTKSVEKSYVDGIQLRMPTHVVFMFLGDFARFMPLKT